MEAISSLISGASFPLSRLADKNTLLIQSPEASLCLQRRQVSTKSRQSHLPLRWPQPQSYPQLLSLQAFPK